ncbi:MAG TPA: YchF-related putative GTPase [Candidatus Thalassarchaeaceae archaeon]|nr:YchF-related putative GTPase [Candidatus Thalassarchaeaceae archaeon]
MRIGLVGKPNVGKSTAFSALTMMPVEIANYPFTTIDPNVGVTWLPLPEKCACFELRLRKESGGRLSPVSERDPRMGSICEPSSGSCTGHRRLIPVTLVDVAGLVPGAHTGRGRGNQFLSDLARCDALIQVIDISGSTDIEGNPVGSGGSEPIDERQFLLEELDSWISGILASGWERASRRSQAEGVTAIRSYILDRLTGIGANDSDISLAINSVIHKHPSKDPSKWENNEIMNLASSIRKAIFPISVAANKADRPNLGEYSKLKDLVEKDGGEFSLTCAEAELALRRAAAIGMVTYHPGDTSFNFIDNEDNKLSVKQRAALDSIRETMPIWGGGLTALISQVVFNQLSRIVTYPVQDETHWVDGDGRPLPDAILVPSGTTARELAYSVHTDLGDGFVRAIDAKTSRVVGADYGVQNNDVIRINSKN